MTRDEAMEFLENQHHGIITTLLPDGRPHPTPIVFDLLDKHLEISMTWDRVKTRNLQRDPRTTICVLPESGFYPYLCVEGRAKLIEDPDGRKNLDLYRRITGQNPDDVPQYLQAMQDEKRLVVRVFIQRLYPISD